MMSVPESLTPGPMSSKVSLSTSMDCLTLRRPGRDPTAREMIHVMATMVEA